MAIDTNTISHTGVKRDVRCLYNVTRENSLKCPNKQIVMSGYRMSLSGYVQMLSKIFYAQAHTHAQTHKIFHKGLNMDHRPRESVKGSQGRNL